MHMRVLDRPTAEATEIDHLRALEAESIHIFREVVAEFERPVMLYSIGKDSSVLLRLAQKAFHPGPIPFPLLHVDTTYKFREMIEFRDWYAAQVGARLIVHTNTRGDRRRARSRSLVGTQRCCGLLKTTCAARRARGGRLRRGVRRRAPRRGAVAREGARVLDSRRQGPVGSEAAAAGALAPPQQPHPIRARACACSRSRTGPSSTSGSTSTPERIPVVPLYFAKERDVIVRGEVADRPRAAVRAAAAGRAAETRDVPHALAGLLALHRRGPLRRRYRAEDHRRAGRRPAFRAPAARHRPRPGRLDGDQEARGILLDAGPAPHLHGRQRRRREEHADRAPALRLARRLRGPGALGPRRVEEPHRRADRFLAVHRRPAGRARAGHHDRRRVPLFRDRAAQVHPRRHARARTVHAQHGDGRVDGRSRDPARRRAARRAAADRASRAHRAAAGHLDLRPGDQQDGSRRIRRAASSTPSATTSPTLLDGADAAGDSDQRAARRQRDRARASARRGSTARACCRILETVEIAARRHAARAFRLPVQLVIRPDRRLSRIRRADRVGHHRVGDAITVWPSGADDARRRGSSRGTAISTSRSRRCRSRWCSPTRSTSAAATCWRRARIEVGRRFSANVVWMDERPLDPSSGRSSIHTTSAEKRRATSIGPCASTSPRLASR